MVDSPLARGWLASRGMSSASEMSPAELKRLETYLKARSLYGNESDITVRKCLANLAERRGVSMSCLAMSWVLSRPLVTSMLCGVLQDNHLDEAIAALEMKLDAEEIEALDAAYRPQALKDTGLGAVLQSGKNSK
jgi:aryl-alcohol dehydrogenase-like predicted oxidoreductase